MRTDLILEPVDSSSENMRNDSFVSKSKHYKKVLTSTKIIAFGKEKGFPGAVVKNLPVNETDARDVGSIPGWGRSPGGGNGNPFQYSCLGNPMDRGA